MATRRDDPIGREAKICQWINLEEALHHFATYAGSTQSQQHIKPLHWYVACRLVIEGGFHPDNVAPRPPFSVEAKGHGHLLSFDPATATGGERTILGGLKTKSVDVAVMIDGIGPVMAVSCKGMTGALRNLTNRMEETIGECTNLHITYPAMVFGYLFVIRANRELSGGTSENSGPSSRNCAPNDIAVQRGGTPAETIMRFHSALRELTGRRGIRNDLSRYEAIALTMVESGGERIGEVFNGFPPLDSPLRMDSFFQTLYLRYEERYLLGAPGLRSSTHRLAWAPESPIFSTIQASSIGTPALDYLPRQGD
ncbi:hypothetical protein BURK2_04270 [Burkholderiales bacterium]|nr:MAG: hypothetical protein F9K47_10310 [Burkholderiales bacterium]CAG1011460.1 hypothetical protein BURK2_04270 [Burkholderiales bacterium]